MGSWEVLAESSEVPAVHAALLPSGEVVYYSGNEGFPAEARVWDPTSGTVYTPPNAPDTDLFCSGLTLTFDGRLFVVVGHSDLLNRTRYPLDRKQGGIPLRADRRVGASCRHVLRTLVPSAICLPDGRILVASGEGEDGGRTQQIQIYDLQGGWSILPVSANRYFPSIPACTCSRTGKSRVPARVAARLCSTCRPISGAS